MGVAALLAAILVSVLGLSVGSAAVVAAPKVTSFSPASGPVGTKVVVTGTAFTAATSVQFAGKEATYTVNSATQITATVPDRGDDRQGAGGDDGRCGPVIHVVYGDQNGGADDDRVFADQWFGWDSGCDRGYRIRWDVECPVWWR